MKKRFLSCLAVVWAFSVTEAAPESAGYAKLAKLVQDGKYSEALPGLESYMKSRWQAGEQERGVVLYIESCLQLHKNAEARKAAGAFLDFYAKSAYRDRVETALAMLDITSGNAFNGAELLRRVLAYSENPQAKLRARESLQQVLDAHLLSSDEMQSLLEKGLSDSDATLAVQMELGGECKRAKRFKAARYWYDKVAQSGGAKAAEALRLKNELEDKGAGTPVVLVLASLSGEYAEFGTAMVRGVLLAQEEFKGAKAFELRIVDDRADAGVALVRTKEAMLQDSIVGVVGPVMSAPASAVAAWMGVAYAHIPLLTPTATDDGIARMGPNIFQVNISTARLARAIAEYSMECLGISEFAIMAPNNDYGSSMTQEFSRMVENRGGRILAVQTFVEGRPDYKTEFSMLRDRKFNLDTKRRNMARGSDNLQAISGKEKKAWMEDSIVTYPGLFMPSSDPNDAGLMAGQAAFYKLGGRLLGSSGWYGRDLLASGKRQVENSFFSVAFAENTEAGEYTRFAKKFKEKWQSEPGKDKVSGLSYDATRILLSTWTQGDGTNLPKLIYEKSTFPGVYGEVRFRSSGANQNTHILAVEGGKFVNKDKCETK